MNADALYDTVIPVLLDGKDKAGRLALSLYRRYGLTAHWFGRGWSLLLATYTKRHPLGAPFSALSDGIRTKMLLDFASEAEANGGLLALIPCSDDAELYIRRAAGDLESGYVLLAPTADPLRELTSASRVIDKK